MFAMGLAEWIIDDTCLVYSLLKRRQKFLYYHFVKN